jgi:glycosyltransferase involved in cell wall biosynthesis
MTKVRVGFPVLGLAGSWNGGFNYIKNLVNAIIRYPDSKLEPVLLVPGKFNQLIRAEFPDIEILDTSLLNGYSPWRIISKGVEKLYGRNLPLEYFLNKHRIDLLSHGQALGPRSLVASLCWIPDFQHLSLPQYFSDKELKARDKSFKKIINFSTLVLVSSFSAKSALELFEPLAINRSRVFHFVVPQVEQKDVIPLDQLESRYGFSRPFFYLPNHFWMHKNHMLVVEALVQLEKRGIEALVVSTGKPNDYRNSSYFAKFQEFVEKRGQAQRFIVLGEVPYEHVVSLMSHSMGVVNPSFFEGWSTTVEEAKTLGKTVLLSDISVHREQAPVSVIYFSPESEFELADAMEFVINRSPGLCQDFDLEPQQDTAEFRFMRFAKNFEDIAMEAVELHKSGGSGKVNIIRA